MYSTQDYSSNYREIKRDGWALRRTVEPGAEPLTLAEAKLHLKVTFTDDDALITSLIVAVRQAVEAITLRSLITQTWELTLDRFPCYSYEPISIPRPRLQSVTSISYTDLSGITQVWDPIKYVVDIKSEPGRIVPAYGEIYPSTRDVLNAVTVLFVAGYGNAATVPENIKSAMKLMIGHLYEHRETVIIAGQPFEMPFSAEALLRPSCILGVH